VALAQSPAEERAEWQRFWADVDALLEKALNQEPTTAAQG
jgi:hypothetical protein